MSSPFHSSGYFEEPTSVGNTHDEKDDKRSVIFAAGKVDAGLDSNETSDINPSGLTFEEGLSLQFCLQGHFSDM